MGERGSAVLASQTRRERVTLDDGATAAWLLAIPCAALVALLAALLGKPLGQLVYPPLKPSDVFPWEHPWVLPEPREEGRYLLALLLPVLLAPAVLATVRRRPQIPERLVRSIVPLARAATIVVIGACLIAQQRARYVWVGSANITERFFTPATLIAGAAIAAAVVGALRGAAVRRRIVAALREASVRRIGASAIAAAVTALWLLHAINTDASIAWTYSGVSYNVPFTLDDPFAVLNGRTPFVDMAPDYASLWPLLAALPLAALGKTLLVFTLTMCALSAVSLLAVYDILRRVTRSSLGALLVYLPFLATSLFTVEGTQAHGYTIATYFAVFPLRYAGPLLLAWLTARQLDRPADRRAWPLFAAAGLVLINNVNFGLPAFAATFVALATRGVGRRLVRDAVAGALLAILAVCVITVARAGALPDFGQLSAYSRYFLGGYMSTPILDVLGVYLVVFLTYVAALAVATVRVHRRELGVLTGMLAWSGTFGLGALSYFIAESGPQWLKASFSAWALALALLAVVVVQRLAASGRRWPELPELAVLFGIGVMACSLAQLATPWSQASRLTAERHGTPPGGVPANPYLPDPAARPFVASLADGRAFLLKPGAPVALLVNNGHRIADAYGIVNVSPYANIMNMFAPSFVRTVVDALRDAGGNTIVLAADEPATTDIYHALVGMGFGVVTNDGIARVTSPRIRPRIASMRGAPIMKLVDLQTPHPRALQDGQGAVVERIERSPW